jgi:ribonuclease HII
MKICALDEVGCASIAGPVFVCAVIIDTSVHPIAGIGDSKVLSRKKRESLFPLIVDRVDDFAYGAAGPRKIEKINIHHAKYLAMRQAVEKLLRRGNKIDRTIVDGGFTIPGLPLYINQEAHPKADKNFWEVSAASILAKVTRDNLLSRLAKRKDLGYYKWESNAGYYTEEHRVGVILHGPTPYHRKTFGFYKYCMFCHNEYKKFLDRGCPEEYFEQEKKYVSHYKAWKRGDFDSWKPVINGVDNG